MDDFAFPTQDNHPPHDGAATDGERPRTSLANRFAPSATGMIRIDHTHVLTTFHRYRADLSSGRKAGLVGMICTALEIHATLEEEIFYPALSERVDNEVMRKSVPEHMEMRRLIAELRAMTPADMRYDETLMALMRDVIHHVADEETVLLPEAERILSDTEMQELGREMTRRRIKLTTPKAGEIARDMARGMPLTTMALGAAAVFAVTRLIRPR
jgi:hemerythrin superfamily protein